MLSRFDEMTPEQQDASEAFIPALVRNVEEAYLTYRDGRLDEEYWLTRAAVLNLVVKSEVGARRYNEMVDKVVPEFATAMEEYIATH